MEIVKETDSHGKRRKQRRYGKSEKHRRQCGSNEEDICVYMCVTLVIGRPEGKQAFNYRRVTWR